MYFLTLRQKIAKITLGVIIIGVFGFFLKHIFLPTIQLQDGYHTDSKKTITTLIGQPIKISLSFGDLDNFTKAIYNPSILYFFWHNRRIQPNEDTFTFIPIRKGTSDIVIDGEPDRWITPFRTEFIVTVIVK